LIPDKERKLINILSNFSTTHKRMPTFDELYKKTGLREGIHRNTLNRLAERYVLTWDGKDIQTVKLDPQWRYFIDKVQ